MIIPRLISKMTGLVRKPLATAPVDQELAALLESAAPYTMVGSGRLTSLYRNATAVIAANVPGHFVECGTCRGGSAAMLAVAARKNAWQRQLYLFESFMGHPDTASAEAPDADLVEKYAGTLVASINDVKCALQAVDAYSPNHVHITPGWFQDTLNTIDIPQIAVLHLDGDWYDSTKCCLEAYYDRVVPGGFVQIDDYNYELMHGCKKATEEFFAQRTNYTREYIECALVIRKQ